MSTRDWLVPGGVAVVLQPYSNADLRAREVVIEKVLARDVVVSSGDRFNKETLRRQAGGIWGYTLYLVSESDPRVAEVRLAIRKAQARQRAKNTYVFWVDGKVSAAKVASAFISLHEEFPDA